MKYADTYLEKHARGNPFINNKPSKGLKYIVTIPAYLETSLIESLDSLSICTPPKAAVEVIIAINWPENESTVNIDLCKEILSRVENWIHSNSSPWISFYCIILPGVPVKFAGVGYARKIAMDEAIRRFIKAEQKDGIIISFDGDTICDTNYFVKIESHFALNPEADGCTVYFEHPLEGNIYPPLVYLGITLYELHLRYYLYSIRYTGFPNAFYTLGSAFAVRARSYCLQGGMNTKKAGEDFYFLQKFFDLGLFTELNSTRVIPSPRPSSRVPFGTGAAIMDFTNSKKEFVSFSPNSFELLKNFFEILPLLYSKALINKKSNPYGKINILGDYLNILDFANIIDEIKRNSLGYESFRKRFFRFFNMFRILKYLNYAKNEYPDLPVKQCAGTLLKKMGHKEINYEDPKVLLGIFRKMDRFSISPQ